MSQEQKEIDGRAALRLLLTDTNNRSRVLSESELLAVFEHLRCVDRPIVRSGSERG